MSALCRALHIDPTEVLERLEFTTLSRGIEIADVDDELENAKSLFRSGNFRGALAIYDSIMDVLTANSVERPKLARVEINRSTTLRRCGELRAADASARRATELAAGNSALSAEAFMLLASINAFEGHSTLAKLFAARAVDLSTSASDAVRCQALTQRGAVLARDGAFERARQDFLSARRISVKLQNHATLARIEGNIGACYLETGRLSLAARRFRSAIEIAHAHSEPSIVASWTIELGRTRLMSRDTEGASQLARRALALCDSRTQPLNVFRAEWLLHKAKPAEHRARRRRRLDRLYPRVRTHRSIPAVIEFEAEFRGPSGVEDA
ncbi:hypothetical protein ABI59_05295 [Acidobacteria bacterium Mor1]|nr:hypothetical protein ABI59_05295 [Acidobacteria bacterium Mor1]